LARVETALAKVRNSALHVMAAAKWATHGRVSREAAKGTKVKDT